jgi:hypothetical protein
MHTSARVEAVTTIFNATDKFNNTATLNLTTIVVDVLPPTISYATDYATLINTSTLLVEVVNASLNQHYTVGNFTVLEQPSQKEISLTTVPNHSVDLSMSLLL